MVSLEEQFATAARLIDQADSLIIGAGAGMGIDSGLPDFRGPGGFWKVYPALGKVCKSHALDLKIDRARAMILA